MKNKLKISYNAPMILTFVIICFFATALGVISNGKFTELFFSVYRGSLINPLTYLRLFTHIFGHSSFEHFMGNAMFLLLLGPMLEEKYGSKIMFIVIALTSLVTGIVHCVLYSNTALCGASGVVFACIILSSFTSFKEGEIPLSFILVAFLFIGKEIYEGITIVDNISNLTHILGGTVGGFSGYVLNINSSRRGY